MTKTKAAEIIARALEVERIQRAQLLRRYANEGHVHVLSEGHHHDELWLSLQGDIFREKREGWPSIELTAKVSLAIASGRSDRNEVPPLDRDVEEALTSWRGRNFDRVLGRLPYRGGKINWAKELP